MMKTIKNIPELRFPEFDGEWSKFTIGGIAKIFSGGTPASHNKDYFGGSIPFIKSGEINSYTTEQTLTEVGLRNSSAKLVGQGDLLLAIYGATSGEVSVSKISGAINQAVICLRGNFHNYFLYNWFQLNKSRIISTYLQGGQGNLSGDIIKKINLKLPPPPEQKKIASFLSAADQRIQLLTQKKEKLEQYKKGIMQQIFSQQLRFKDENGKDYPDWEETQFGSLYRFISTNSLSREKLNYESGLVKNIHYGDIHTKFKSHLIIDNELVPYINPDVDLEKINSDNFLMKGDLVIADASEDYFDIGKSIEICQLNGQLVLAGLHTLQARRKSNCPTIGYGGHMMKSNEVRTQIQRIAQGTKVLSIAANRLSDISIKIPCKAEQQKIASFLSSLDQKIILLNQQIEHTRIWKKGLLQKMFV